MGITISLGDILQLALGGAGVVLLIYLVIMIKNLNTVLSEAKSLITKNRANLDKTIQSLPDIAENVESITGGVKTE